MAHEPIDYTGPDLDTPDLTPQQIAAKRGWQTLADGAIVVAVVAVIVPLVGAVQSADGWAVWLAGWQDWTWRAVQAGIVAGGTAVVSWMRRRWVQPAEPVTARRADGGGPDALS